VEQSANAQSAKQLMQLRQLIAHAFDLDDIQTLCFDMGLDYENLAGQTKDGKTRSLIMTKLRRDELPDLIHYCVAARPNLDWSVLHQSLPSVLAGYQETQAKQQLLDQKAQQNFERSQLEKDTSRFSAGLREQLLKVGKTIDALTTDQFEIIRWLRGHKRARIAGCAGSGKTLAAVENAIRLDAAGLRTLFLTHSPHLARMCGF
jgi:hypothetical protein